MKTFRLAHSDQVQASIREYNADGFDINYINTELGFDVYTEQTRVAIVAFWGTQPAIRIENPLLKASTLLIGADAVELAGELIALFVKEHHAK